jgi:hypothetical protein
LPSLNPKNWIASLLGKRGQDKKEPTMADVAGLIIKDTRLSSRIAASKEFDFTDDKSVIAWARKNIGDNLPFLMAGDKRDADSLVRDYAAVLAYREYLKDLLMTTQTFYRHKECKQEAVRRMMPAMQRMKVDAATGAVSVEAEQGAVEYQYCLQCKIALSPDDMETWEVSSFRKPHYQKYMESWDRVVAECSIVVYGKSFYPEHIDPRPLVVHNTMPSLGGPGMGGMGGFPGLGESTPALTKVEASTEPQRKK